MHTPTQPLSSVLCPPSSVPRPPSSAPPAPSSATLPEFCLGCFEGNARACRDCWARLDGDLDARFLVRLASPSAPALLFHANLCGRVYCVVADAEASTFGTPAEARAAMVDHKLDFQHAQVMRVC